MYSVTAPSPFSDILTVYSSNKKTLGNLNLSGEAIEIIKIGLKAENDYKLMS